MSSVVAASSVTMGEWIAGGAVFLAGIAIGRGLQAVLFRVVRRGDADKGAALAVGRFVAFVFATAGLVYGLSVLGVKLGPLVGAIGIGGLAIAFAAQAILANFLGSIILQLRRPFHRGDQISTYDCEGTVEDVNFRTVVLRTFDGERALIPCAEVLARPIINYTVLGRRRTTLSISVGYDADLVRVRELLLEAVAGADGVLDQPPPEVWVEEFADSGIELAVRFWHAPDIATKWRVRNNVAVVTKQTLDRAGVDIPFPQRVIRFAVEDGREESHGAAGEDGAEEARQATSEDARDGSR
ncbi:MAG: mechanosensitive ion channel family protein [Actinomycetota bacterium]|nr:mechanosensitive ion channel family protein [Actinomycetota bacterium]